MNQKKIEEIREKYEVEWKSRIYWWEDTTYGSELWASEFYEKKYIGRVTQCDDELDFWRWTCNYFDLGTNFLYAETLEKAKECFVDRLHRHFEDQIDYYKRMMQLFETT